MEYLGEFSKNLERSIIRIKDFDALFCQNFGGQSEWDVLINFGVVPYFSSMSLVLSGFREMGHSPSPSERSRKIHKSPIVVRSPKKALYKT